MCDPDTVAPMAPPVDCVRCHRTLYWCQCPPRRRKPIRPDFTLAEVTEAFSRWLRDAPTPITEETPTP